MTPGVLSRPHNDGSGRQNYYASGVEHREHVTQMDGFMAANYWDMNVNRTGLSGEAISDTNVKLAGVDASAPMGYGLVINMISKSGGNSLSGSAGYTVQPFSWNGNNAAAEPAGRRCRHAGHPESRPVRRVARRPDSAATRPGSSAPIAGRTSIPRWTARPPTCKPSRRSRPISSAISRRTSCTHISRSSS